ncbi:hypothetical protein V1264_008722 [Littorina saxatilis]|uniref:Uncharacterized protein n=1 Tax=Littorina saxatilis TaxID=31220 RepID=A0AAN9AUZ7_9CAEN
MLGELNAGGGTFSKEVEFDLNQSTDIFTTSSTDTETTEAEPSTNLKAFKKSQDLRFFILLGCFGAVLLFLVVIIIVVGVVFRRRGRSSRLTSPDGPHTSQRSARDGAVFHAARAGHGDRDPRVSGYAHVYTEIVDGADGGFVLIGLFLS